MYWSNMLILKHLKALQHVLIIIVIIFRELVGSLLTLNLLTTTIVAPRSNASKWQTGFNSAFKGFKSLNLKF